MEAAEGWVFSAMNESNVNSPTFLFDELPLHWQMTRCEKLAFASILDAAAPEIAIEIGTYKGGSLQLISRKSKQVYSLDIASLDDTLAKHFDNVEFRTGPSQQLLPALLRQIQEERQPLGFVLIDGDHSTEGVRQDINAVLQYEPIRPLYIVFHDSFHPPCREGILSASWQDCPWVHYVEVDFIPGVYHYEAFDTAEPRSMYGGLAVAVMKPTRRTGALTIHQSQSGLYNTVFRDSRHSPSSSLLHRAKRWLTRTE
ncbi:MAG: class I SAM-dependent methyltransferase [Fuerstiella sp.]|nr:class I SAM-dependent methyltransferase [Fuerstiella sp.]